MNHFIFCLMLACISLMASPYAAYAEKVRVYTYHKRPPYFIIDTENPNIQQQGIYVDFVKYLNAKQDEFDFELHFLPRIRLEGFLKANNLDGIVIGVNPTWFLDDKREKYLWTSAIMHDENVFLVNDKVNHKNYMSNEQFIGGRIALTRGSYHKGISELVQQGKIEVFLTSNEMQSLAMILYDRVDFTIVSTLTLGHFLKHNKSRKKLHVLAPPHYKYERMILIPKYQSVYFSKINELVQQAETDIVWRKKLEAWDELSLMQVTPCCR